MSHAKRIVVKVGTNVLTREDGALDKLMFREIVVQLVKLKRQGWHPILVSSGAVGAGKAILKESHIKNEAVRRQTFSAIGQTSLMKRYFELFIEYDVVCAQVLATKEDFSEGEHYQNMINCFEGLLEEGVVPVVNENDVVSLEELMFTDNDELAGLTANMVGASKLIILSNVDGVYDSTRTVVHEVSPDDMEVESYISTEKSGHGRGGMHSKFSVARQSASNGIETYIANGKRDGVILDILEGKQIGTKFLTTS